MLLPIICSNQDLVKTILERNPEEFRYVAQIFGSVTLPVDLNVESIHLGYLCGQKFKAITKENVANSTPKGNK